MNTATPIEPERRVVTILYADIVGSTKIISELDPDDAAEFLDPAINKIIRSIHNFGGTVARVQGDGVKAVFGATQTQEDHALRAALAGLEMVKLLQAGPQRPGIPRADLRVGMHSGYVIVRWQKNDLGGGLDTVGSTGHVAAKIEQIARPNHVTLSETSADLIKGGANFAPVRTSDIEQDGKKLQLFEINELSADHSIAETDYANMLPLVGRTQELQRLNTVFESGFKSGQNRIYVVGDAGIGKSRLVREVSFHAAKRNVRVEFAGGVGVFKNTPYNVLRSLASRLLRLSPHYKTLHAGDFIDELGLSEREQLGLTKLVSENIDEIAAWNLPVDDKLMAIQTAIVALIKYLVKHAPLLIIVEDVHDVDPESVRCLEFVIRNTSDLPVGLIATTRPVGEDQARKLTDTRLELLSLRKKDSRSLIRNEIDQRSHTYAAHDVDDMVEDIIGRAEGLPLALKEFSKLFSTRSEVTGSAGQMPLALEPLIHRKFDILSPDALTTIQYASALGNAVSEAQLRQTISLPDDELNRALVEIFDKKILRRSSDDILSFEHHLYHEICYDSMVRNRKRTIHTDIYKSLVQIAKDAHTQTAAYGPQILAYHAEEAGLLEPALDHLWQACSQAIATSGIRTAQGLYHRAANVCDLLGEDFKTRKIKFASLVFDALHQLAAHEEVLDVFQAARDKDFQALSPNEQVVIRANIGTILWIGGKPEQGYPDARAAMELADELDYLPISTFAGFALANIEFALGHTRQSIDRLNKISAHFKGKKAAIRFGQSITLPGVLSRAFASWYAVDMGDIKLAKRLEEEAREIANQEDHGYSKTLCDLAAGYRHLRTGEFAKASKILHRAYDSCIAESYFGLAPMSASWTAQALIWCDEDEKARVILEQELELNHIKSVQNSGKFYLLGTYGLLQARSGKYEDAIDYHTRAMETAQECNDPVHLAYGYYGKGRLLSVFGNDPESAKAEFETARTFARKCEMSRLERACEIELSRLA